MKINRVGVDLAKNVFQLHGADHKGKTVWKRQLSRGQWLRVLSDPVEPGTEIAWKPAPVLIIGPDYSRIRATRNQ